METQATTINNDLFLINLEQKNWEPIKISYFFNIGKNTDSHLYIDEEKISPRHCRIEYKTNGYILRDLKSTHGTFLNGVDILEAKINDGDKISIGNQMFLVTEKIEYSKLKSKNEFWQNSLNKLPLMAKTDFPILINGPSGTGKEIISSWIHENSLNKFGPLIKINCSALSEQLIESELFGHMKGSFTGATENRKGAFEAAKNGTLMLDEIGDLPISLQPKLLRAIENQEIRPVGSDKTIKTNVRILAATHKNLKKQVEINEFRMDLFFRLNVCHIQIPSLKSRLEDFESICYEIAKKYRVRFSFNAILKMKEYSWPGNIRELKNVIQRASAYFPKNYITEKEISELLDFDSDKNKKIENNSGGTKPFFKEVEKNIILDRLVANHGNQRKTAMELGMPKSTLHDRLKNYNINAKKYVTEFNRAH